VAARGPKPEAIEFDPGGTHNGTPAAIASKTQNWRILVRMTPADRPAAPGVREY
jgi:hypothetical protein